MSDMDEKIKKLESTNFLPSWVRKDKVNKIKDLEIFPQVHEWFLDGVPNSEIARRIQSHGLMTDYEISDIVGYLGHYRATVPPGAMLMRQRPTDVAKVYKRLTPMKTYIENLDDMIAGQLGEVQKAKRMAEESPVPIGLYGDEIERYLKIISQVHRLRKEAGLTDRDIESAVAQEPWAFDLDKIYGKKGITERLKDPKSRVKILGTVERLLEMVQLKQAKGEEFSFEQVIDVKNQEPTVVEASAERSAEPMPNPDQAAEVVNKTDGITVDNPPLEVIEQIDLSTLTADDLNTDPENP